GHSQYTTTYYSIHDNRRNGAFSTRDQTHTCYATPRTIFQEIKHDIAGQYLAIIFLQHGIAEMASIITGTGQGHVNSNGSNTLPPFPGLYPVEMPLDLGAIEN